MKFLIYKKNLIRMIYAQDFLFDRSIEKWYIRSNFQNYFWEIFLKFLQNDIQSIHLRIIDVADFIKKLKQRADQSMNELIMIFISFEKNFSKILTKIQRHFNLFHAMHDFLKRTLLKVDRQRIIKTWFVWRISHSSLDQGEARAIESSRHRELASSRPRAASKSDETFAKWWEDFEMMTACFVMNKALHATHLEHFELSAFWDLNTSLIFHSFSLFFSFFSVCRLSMTRHLLNLFIELIVT